MNLTRLGILKTIKKNEAVKDEIQFRGKIGWVGLKLCFTMIKMISNDKFDFIFTRVFFWPPEEFIETKYQI